MLCRAVIFESGMGIRRIFGVVLALVVASTTSLAAVRATVCERVLTRDCCGAMGGGAATGGGQKSEPVDVSGVAGHCGHVGKSVESHPFISQQSFALEGGSAGLCVASPHIDAAIFPNASGELLSSFPPIAAGAITQASSRPPVNARSNGFPKRNGVDPVLLSFRV
jgi:hypothetical protein